MVWSSLKKSYSVYHKQLQQTGHGLIMADREDEIISGSPIGNVWEKMKLKFPWYRRLHLLLCGSPIYDMSALANSTTPLNTSVLANSTTSLNTSVLTSMTPLTVTTGSAVATVDRSGSPEWDMNCLEADLNASASPIAPPFDDDSSMRERSSPPPEESATPSATAQTALAPFPSLSPPASAAVVPSTPVVTHVVDEAPKTIPSKRKLNTLDTIKEFTEAHQAGRLETERIRAEGKRQRALIYSENQLSIECMKHEDGERQRLHELAVLDKKIELARLQAGNSEQT
ncbi:hypothetical protein CPB84DRAFT_1401552 [Gymnopilus junonius]|uniref:No apical meristem-associated C-terminal domain-containing protein n=1 Tax=Gymnopilus junonius TaxID=109634 RepID=A0A9P5TK06_GYMJU|nr:hypothetical protein CPB84DRAFT_1401552 [Gymnopilus junonius]